MQLTPNVTIRGDVVEKRGSARELRIEMEKMRLASRIAKTSGLFRVPELVGLDPEDGVLRMEYISGLRGIRRVRLPEDRYLALVNRSGKALRVIHRELGMPSEFLHPLPDVLKGGGEEVFLHGDYSGENVCVVEGSGEGQLVLIDWQSTPRIGDIATFGTHLFDVCWFIGNLFRKPAYDYLTGPAVQKAAWQFIRGYMGDSIESDELVRLGEYLDRLHDYRIEHHESRLPLPKRILLAPGLRAWKAFSGTLNVRVLENA